MKKYTFLLVAFACYFQAVKASSEFYLKINVSGYYKVKFADQQQITSTNEFRFHGLNAGTWTLTVSNEADQPLFTTAVALSEGYRMVAELNNFSNIQLIGSFQMAHQSWYLDGYSSNTQVIATVDDYTFGMIKDHLSSYSNTENKLRTAKEITKNNRLTSQQVTEICGLFKYESTRLEYAKYAYNYVIDKGLYFLIYSVLSYSSDDELRDYIANH